MLLRRTAKSDKSQSVIIALLLSYKVIFGKFCSKSVCERFLLLYATFNNGLGLA